MGLASKARLKELLKGSQVEIECSKEKGKFGRVLGIVWATVKEGNRIDCNNQLCLEGHARPYNGGRKEAWV